MPAGEHWWAVAVVGIPDSGATAEVQAWWRDLAWRPGTPPAIVRGGDVLIQAEPIPVTAHLTAVAP